MNPWTSMPTGRRMPFAQPVVRHDAGAGEPALRSSDNARCRNRFHDRNDYSMEDR
jgi:hypothetical protein